MAKVLFGWEFGGGMGHLTALLPIAQGLADSHEPVFVVKNLASAATLLTERGEIVAGASLLQAPRWPTRKAPSAQEPLARSLADTLKIHGYPDPALLYGQARGWRDIMRLVDPSLVVADFAPTLLLAARGVVPTIAIGSGYTTPPGGAPLRPMRPWEKDLPPESRVAEQEALRSVQAVQRKLGCTPAAHLSDLFEGDRTFVYTIPEFDPYRSQREAPLVDPFNVPSFGQVRPVAERPEGRIFAYLPADHPHLATILMALRRMGLNGDVFVPGLPEAMRQAYASPGLTFHHRLVDLERVLPDAQVIIHHGGHGTSYAALRAGTPQLVLVNNLERLVTSYGLHQLNCAITLNADGKLDVEAVANYLHRLLHEEKIHRAAYDAAQSLAARPAANPVKTVLEACRQMLAGA